MSSSISRWFPCGVSYHNVSIPYWLCRGALNTKNIFSSFFGADPWYFQRKMYCSLIINTSMHYLTLFLLALLLSLFKCCCCLVYVAIIVVILLSLLRQCWQLIKTLKLTFNVGHVRMGNLLLDNLTTSQTGVEHAIFILSDVHQKFLHLNGVTASARIVALTGKCSRGYIKCVSMLSDFSDKKGGLLNALIKTICISK